MKRKRYSVEQIVAAVKQHELGTPAADIARKLGIAEQTFYRWKKEYAGLEPGQARELRQLREENAKLKKIVADLSLDKAMLTDIAKKVVKAPQHALKRRTKELAEVRVRYGYKRIHVLLRREGWPINWSMAAVYGY
jgi:putative transposase